MGQVQCRACGMIFGEAFGHACPGYTHGAGGTGGPPSGGAGAGGAASGGSAASPPKPETCRHSFAHLHTTKREDFSTSPATYKRTDIFFCTYCLEERTKSRTGEGDPFELRTPDWW